MIIRWLGTYFPGEFPELQEDPQSEEWDNLLFYCALRFYGYTSEEERAPNNKVTGSYLVEHCSTPIKKSGQLHTDMLMNMGAMFILQRSVRDYYFVTKDILENYSWLMVLYL